MRCGAKGLGALRSPAPTKPTPRARGEACVDRCCSDPVPSGPPSAGHRDDELQQAPAGGRLPARSEMCLRGSGWQVTAAGRIQSPRPGHTSDHGGRPRSTPSARQPAAALSLTLHTMDNLPVKVTERFHSALAQYLRSHGSMSECPHARLGAQRSSGIAHRTSHGSVTALTRDKTQVTAQTHRTRTLSD